jgi:hypothetical protein
MKYPPDSGIEIVQFGDTHPLSGGEMYVGKDGELHPFQQQHHGDCRDKTYANIAIQNGGRILCCACGQVWKEGPQTGVETRTTRYKGEDGRERAVILWEDYEQLLSRIVARRTGEAEAQRRLSVALELNHDLSRQLATLQLAAITRK